MLKSLLVRCYLTRYILELGPGYQKLSLGMGKQRVILYQKASPCSVSLVYVNILGRPDSSIA